MTERITITVPEELAEEINAQLEYGDNRSEWIREAIRMRLEAESEVDGEGNQRTAVTAD